MKKIAVFSDLHLGKFSDSKKHNDECMKYVDWFITQATEFGADSIIFIGDLFDNRSRIRLDTQHYGNEIVKKLAKTAPTYLVVGNHDMFMRENRDIHSLSCYKEFDNVTVADKCMDIDGIGLVPFLIGTEYLEVIDLPSRYLFGHFELPGFLMNSSTEHRGNGGFDADGLTKPELVFSGHFHKRQLKKNKYGVPVWYIGNPFGHDFNDVNDTDRGMMLFEVGNEPTFLNYEGPLYQRFTTEELADVLDAPEKYIRKSSILEIRDNMDSTMEELMEIKEILEQYVDEVRVIESRKKLIDEQSSGSTDIEKKSIEEIVIDHLRRIDPRGDGINSEMLVKIFEGV